MGSPRLPPQGAQVAGARTEAEALARLAAESLSTTPGGFAQVAATLRNAFDLDSVTVLRRVADGWSPEFVVGEHAPHRPEDVPFTAELSDGRILAFTTRAGADRDDHLLRSFMSTLRHRREHDQLARSATGSTDDPRASEGRS